MQHILMVWSEGVYNMEGFRLLYFLRIFVEPDKCRIFKALKIYLKDYEYRKG